MKHQFLPLSEINFGSLDAETEVTLDQGRYFDKVYSDPFKASDGIRNGKFIVHGRKGTGKSALACFINRSSSSDLFVQKLEYSMKDIEAIVQDPSFKETSASQSQALWQWIFLCLVGKFVLDDQSINISADKRQELERFYKINQGYCSPGSLELREQIAKDKLEVRVAVLNRLLKVSGISEVDSTNGRANFLKLLFPLQQLLNDIFSSSRRSVENEYLIVIDNLDTGYIGSEIQKGALLGILRAAKNMFTSFHEFGCRLYPVVLIRTDMLQELMFESDTNKLMSANGLKLNWYDHQTYIGDERSVPLRNLISTRIKYSYQSAGIDIEDGWTTLFRKWKGENKTSFKYLIDKTLYRPRDLISLFNQLKENFKTKDCVTKDMVDRVSKPFAAYMVQEWQNELSAHCTPNTIQQLFNSLKGMAHKGRFTIETFTSTLQQQSMAPQQLLEIAFGSGLICAFPKNRIAWSHRPSPEVDSLDLTSGIEMEVHFAFADHFSRPQKRFW